MNFFQCIYTQFYINKNCLVIIMHDDKKATTQNNILIFNRKNRKLS